MNNISSDIMSMLQEQRHLDYTVWTFIPVKYEVAHITRYKSGKKYIWWLDGEQDLKYSFNTLEEAAEALYAYLVLKGFKM